MAKAKGGRNAGDDKKVSFEETTERLEKLVAELESGDLTLDQSLARYEEGRLLIRQCYKLLQGAEQRIEALVKGEDGETRVAPFDPDAPGGEPNS